MTVDSKKTPSSADRKFQMRVDTDQPDDKHIGKARRLFQSTSILYPILLGLVLIIGTILVVLLLLTRQTTPCRAIREEKLGASLGLLPKDHTVASVSCVRTSQSGSCVCPASFIHSSVNPSHCIPTHSRCLQSCTKNQHCACYNIADAHRCKEVTRRWIEEEVKIGPVEAAQRLKNRNILHYPWSDHSARQIEHLLVNTKAGERLFFSADQRTGITIHEDDDDYLLNEHWTKIESNTTEQHVIYTQLDPQTHTCRMSLIGEDESVTHGSTHTCPGATINAPYYLGVACQNVLVLWHGARQSKIRRQEGWTVSRHQFESTLPRLSVLLDPFHRYYSLYDDLMIEIKDLNGDILAQLFTDIYRPTKFDFIDQYGTIRVANRTHMQLISSKNHEAWLDF